MAAGAGQFNLKTGRWEDIAPGDGQRGTHKKTDEAELNERLFHEYRNSARVSWEEASREDYDFYDGNQWTAEEIQHLREERRAPIVVNVIKPSVERAVGLMTTNAPRFHVTGGGDSHHKMGKMFSDLFSHIWRVNSGNTHHESVINDYYIKGMGVWFTWFDPEGDFGKGEVKLMSIDPYDVYIDPNSNDPYARDAAHIVYSKVFTGEKLQQMIPDIVPILNIAEKEAVVVDRGSSSRGQQSDTQSFSDNFHQGYRVIDRYSRIKVEYISLIGMNEEEIVTTQEGMQALAPQEVILERSVQGDKLFYEGTPLVQQLKLHEETGGIFHFREDPETGQPIMVPGPAGPEAIPDSEVVLEKTTMGDLIGSYLMPNSFWRDHIRRIMTVGSYEVANEVLPVTNYPIIPIMNRWDRTPYPKSDVRYVKPLQEYINKNRSLILAHTANIAGVKGFIPRGSSNIAELERRFQRAGAALFEYNAEFGAPAFPTIPPLSNQLYMNEEQARRDIELIFGVYALSQGDPSQGQETFRGTLALDEFAQRTIAAKLRRVEGGVIEVGKVIMNMVQAYYTQHKSAKVVQPNDEREIEINVPIYDSFGREIERQNDVTVGEYEIIVVPGSSLPSHRWAELDMNIRLMELGILDDIEVMKKLDNVDIDDLIERKSAVSQLQQQVQQMEEEIKRLAGQLQTAHRESLNDRKRLELEKYKARLAKQEARALAAVDQFEDEAAEQPMMEGTEDDLVPIEDDDFLTEDDYF